MVFKLLQMRTFKCVGMFGKVVKKLLQRSQLSNNNNNNNNNNYNNNNSNTSVGWLDGSNNFGRINKGTMQRRMNG